MDSSSIVILAVMIFLSAFFSASETALSSVNRIRLKNMADDGNQKAKRALQLAERFDLTLSTILIGNNVVNIAASSLATLVANNIFGSSGVAIATGVMTFLILVFGEVLPKSFAKEHSETVSLAVSGILRVLMVVLYPAVFFFIKLQAFASKLYGSTNNQPYVTEEELVTIIETIEESGFMEKDKSELVQSALEFDDTTISEVLTPRVDLVSLDIKDSHEEILETIFNERFSRLPVYENNIDNIIGIIQTRDYLEATVQLGDKVPLKELMTKPLFVHKSKKLPQLLADFQRSRIHMAVITDDYGGTLGIVTLEDILEEIVGEIWDEDEEIITEIATKEEHSYEASGDINIYDMFEHIGYNAKNFESEYSTLSGWALEELGSIPSVGDSFEYDGIKVVVTEMDEQRITKLDVSYLPK